MTEKGKRKLKKWLIFFVCCAVGFTALYFIDRYVQSRTAPAPLAAGECRVEMIDVGQGDAILLRTVDGTVLVDAGTGMSEKALKKHLDGEGIDSFDYVVFTHPHEDHIGGGDMILDNYKVANVLLPDVTTNTDAFENLLDAIDRSEAEVTTPSDGFSFECGGMRFFVLSPEKVITTHNDLNIASIVMRMDYNGFSALLTGDAEMVNETVMLSNYREYLDCDVLKVGHHGSYFASTEPFIEAVSPMIALISCGKHNDYGHPNESTLERLEDNGAKIYRTDRDSTVTVVSNGEKIRVYRAE